MTSTLPSARPAIALRRSLAGVSPSTCLAFTPAATKGLGDVLRVFDVDAEDDCRDAGTATEIFVDGGPDDDAVHRLADVFDSIVAAAYPSPGKIGPARDWLVHDEGREPSGLDQLSY